MNVRGLVPRRAAGLPPGQREISEFPRFSDKPLRWAPANAPIEFTVSVEGAALQTFTAFDLAKFERIEQSNDSTASRRGHTADCAGAASDFARSFGL